MKRKIWILWLLVVCVLLSGCSLLERGRDMLSGLLQQDREEMYEVPQEDVAQEPICSNRATVRGDTQVYLTPDGDIPVGIVSEDSIVTFDKVVGMGELWVHLTGPGTEGWIQLPYLKVDDYAGALPVEVVAGAHVYALPDTASGEINPSGSMTVIIGPSSSDGQNWGMVSGFVGSAGASAAWRSAITGMFAIDGATWCLMIDGTWVQLHDLVFSCDAESGCNFSRTYPYSLVGSWYYLHGITDDYAEEECWTFREDGTLTQQNFCYGADLTAPYNPDDAGIPGVYVYDGTDLTVSLTQHNDGIYKYMVFFAADRLILIPEGYAECMVFTAEPKWGPEGTLMQEPTDVPTDQDKEDGGDQPSGGGQPSGGNQPSGNTGAVGDLSGVWQAYQVHYMEDGHGGGSGFELYLCENGYGVLVTSDGQIFDGAYYLNYSNQRLYGQWRVSGGTLRFTVLEDWIYSDGQNIGQVLTYPCNAAEDGFTLEASGYLWTFRPAKDWNGYMDIARNAAGNPTGNDQTGTRQDATIEGLAGHWVLFEEDGGKLKRHLLYFNGNGSYSYFCQYMKQEESGWVAGDWVDPYIDAGDYCLVNGSFTLAWGPEEFTGLTVTVSGDTLTITTQAEYWGSTRTGVFTRYDGSTEPMP